MMATAHLFFRGKYDKFWNRKEGKMRFILNNIIISIEKNQDIELRKEIVKRGIKESNIKKIEYLKRSIDSRKKSDIKFVYNIEVSLFESVNLERLGLTPITCQEEIRYEKRDEIDEIIIIGAGPAGIFAALRACELGIKPIIFERGEMIEDRDKTVEKFMKYSILNPKSNIQFGEGGAGTYSDGKLNTRVKSRYMDKIFYELVENGAQKQILWDYKPHIGTDILKIVIKNLREKIISLGGKFYFNSLVTDFIIEKNQIKGIKVESLKSNIRVEEIFKCDNIMLGIGHSSRDTYRILNRLGVCMENKPFAVGTRIEHPVEDINFMQYGKMANHPNLETATYNLTYNNHQEKRGIFSFCMCPGGVIVNASSERGGSLVNGMSYSKRDGKFSNSALVVGVKANEFGDELFSGMKFQEKLEKEMYRIVGDYGAVYQNTSDFLKGRETKKSISSSYEMELKSYDMNKIFPDVIRDNMKMAMRYWEKTQINFIGRNANLIGVETRTSAPIRIVRNEFGESVNIKGLYPIGEGAGYAGGIVSAGIDGMKIVDLAFTKKTERG